MKKKWMSVMMAVPMAFLLLTTTAVPTVAQSEDELTVDPSPVRRAALAIRAPKAARVGEEVTMAVYQRGTQEPIGNAGVWALTRDQATILKDEMAQIRAEGEAATQDIDYESLVSVRGTLLGRTDENGQLTHTFDEAGGYLLVAVKRGYFPGFATIGIRAPQTVEIMDSQRIVR